mmetsp:Transcript_52400/g.162638  ORF Transcript_52400/g.162638 Transcript_52400/m.162638 type:complete len:118 (-) Transcript_52400:275-628(-)
MSSISRLRIMISWLSAMREISKTEGFKSPQSSFAWNHFVVILLFHSARSFLLPVIPPRKSFLPLVSISHDEFYREKDWSPCYSFDGISRVCHTLSTGICDGLCPHNLPACAGYTKTA